MKRFILIIATITAFIALAGTAQADKQFSPTCGTNNNNYYATASGPSYNGSSWHVSWDQVCGSGGTVEWELQHSIDGGSTWQDIGDGSGTGAVDDYLFSTPSYDAGFPATTINKYPGGGCTSTYLYRLRVYSNNNTSNGRDYDVPTCG